MIKVEKVQSLYFSPTGNTKKIVEAVAKGTGLPQANPIELTLPKQREAWSGNISGDLMIIGIPVYASTFPAMILTSLEKLEGAGRLAVPIAVCGNVKMDMCLAEVCGILKKQGFTIPAAGNFVGSHSFWTEECPIGKGRPDEKDLAKAAEFGGQVAKKIKDDPGDITNRSSTAENIWIGCYVRGSLSAKGSYLPPQFYETVKVGFSEADRARCGDCGKCVAACSTGAMKTDLQIDNATCTRCFACVAACPSGVLKKYVDHQAPLIKWFKEKVSYRGEPLTFI